MNNNNLDDRQTSTILELDSIVDATAKALQKKHNVHSKKFFQNNVSASSKSQTGSTTLALKQQKLIIFIKVMFKLMNQNGDNELVSVSKLILIDCKQNNRSKNDKTVPLYNAIVSSLRSIPRIEMYWQATIEFFRACRNR